MNERLTLWLQEDERQTLDETAARLGVSRNRIVRAAVRNALGLTEDWPLLAALAPQETTG